MSRLERYRCMRERLVALAAHEVATRRSVTPGLAEAVDHCDRRILVEEILALTASEAA